MLCYIYLLAFVTVCGSNWTCSKDVSIITESDGWINSPNFPDRYDANTSCHWRIVAQGDIRLKIHSLNNIANKTDKDRVQFTDCADGLRITGNGNISPPIPRALCEEHADDLLYDEYTLEKGDLDNATLDVYFTSDDHFQGKGFTIRFKTDAPIKDCNYTKVGIPCQRWDERFPHEPKSLPPIGDRSHNFCRNPDDDFRGHWCYTSNPRVRWEYCDVDDCDGPHTLTISFKTWLWYPFLGVIGAVVLVAIYLCFKHRCKKVTTRKTKTVTSHGIAMYENVSSNTTAYRTHEEVISS